MIEKPPAKSATTRAVRKCPICRGSGWVCGSHLARPMEHKGCGAPGMRCRCNPQALIDWDELWATVRK